MITDEEKFRTVIEKNTFYFFNPKFEEQYESYIHTLKQTILVVKNEIETHGLKKEIFENLLLEKEYGLKALLALTGFSNENLKRLLTVIRVTNNRELERLVYKSEWNIQEHNSEIKEWNDSTIAKLIQASEYFRKGVVNLFFEGSTIPFLANTLPLFELKKLSISKLSFKTEELIDTIVRYKEKGSYSGNSKNNPEILLKEIFQELHVSFESGDLTELLKNEKIAKRTMDFILPNKTNLKS